MNGAAVHRAGHPAEKLAAEFAAEAAAKARQAGRDDAGPDRELQRARRQPHEGQARSARLRRRGHPRAEGGRPDRVAQAGRVRRPGVRAVPAGTRSLPGCPATPCSPGRSGSFIEGTNSIVWRTDRFERAADRDGRHPVLRRPPGADALRAPPGHGVRPEDLVRELPQSGRRPRGGRKWRDDAIAIEADLANAAERRRHPGDHDRRLQRPLRVLLPVHLAGPVHEERERRDRRTALQRAARRLRRLGPRLVAR